MKLVIINILLLLSFSGLQATREIKWVPYQQKAKSVIKRPRTIWNDELRDLFQTAKNNLSIEEQTPANILKEMKRINENLTISLTREQLSSHLQKERKKAEKNKMSINNILN